MPDFALSAAPATLGFKTTGSKASTIAVAAVGSAEPVTLSLDDSELPAGSFTTSLSPTSLDSGETSILTVDTIGEPPIGSWTLYITGDDGTHTHDLEVAVTVTVPGPVTAYDTLPDPMVEVGSSFLQNVGEAAHAPDLCVHNGEVYCAWTEGQGSIFPYWPRYGPYVAKWDGSSWSLVGSSFESDWDGSTSPQYGRTECHLASDGTNLFIAYLVQAETSQPDLYHSSGTVTVAAFWARVWQYDGSSWTDLGYFGLGSHQTSPPASISPAHALSALGDYALSNNAGSSGGSFVLRLSASADEVGSCYIAFYEDGFAGDTINFPAYRRLTLAGFGGSSLEEDLSSILWEPANISSGVGGWLAYDFPPFFYECELVGSGTSLLLIALEGDVNVSGAGAPYNHPSYWKLWQPGGFLSDLTLAAIFPDPYDPVDYYLDTITISNVVDGDRYISAGLREDYASTILKGIVRSSKAAAPATITDVWGHSQLNISGTLNQLIAEANNIWGLHRNQIIQLADRCGAISWQSASGGYTSASHAWAGTWLLHDDALWLTDIYSGIRVWKIDICRGCGTCPSTGIHAHF